MLVWRVLIGLFLFIAPTLALAQAGTSGIDTLEITDPNKVSLRDYLISLINERDRQYQERFISAERSVAAALASADKATEKANEANDKRFEGVNEIRGTLTDQALTFANKEATDAAITAIDDKISQINSRLDLGQGTDQGSIDFRGLMFNAVMAIAAIGGLAFGVAGFMRAGRRQNERQ